MRVLQQIGNPKEKLYKMQKMIFQLSKVLQEMEFENWESSFEPEGSLESH